eukprot:sb/3468499/
MRDELLTSPDIATSRYLRWTSGRVSFQFVNPCPLSEKKRRRHTFKEVGVMVVAMVRMRHLVRRWAKVRESVEEKQKRRERSVTPAAASTGHSLHRSASSGHPRWDSGRPLTPARVHCPPSPDPSLSRLDQQLARLRSSINSKASYNDLQHSGSQNWSGRSHRLTPERDLGNGHLGSRDMGNSHIGSRELGNSHIGSRELGNSRDLHVSTGRDDEEDDTAGTLSDISNYISRLEAVQNRLTDLKMSSYKIYDSNRSINT